MSGCAQSSLKKLREQLHQQLDADDLPKDPFNFVPGGSDMPVARRWKKLPKYLPEIYAPSEKEAEKSAEQLAVENLQALSDPEPALLASHENDLACRQVHDSSDGVGCVDCVGSVRIGLKMVMW